MADAAELQEPAVGLKKELQGSENGNAQADEDSEADEYEEVVVQQPRGPAIRKGSECPYLDTISRQVSLFRRCQIKELSPGSIISVATWIIFPACRSR